MNPQNLNNIGLNIKLKERVMRRIYAIWFVRRILPRFGGVAVGIFVAYRVTAQSFFVAKILENFLMVSAGGLSSLSPFVISALAHADPRAALVIALSVVAAGLLSFKLLSDIRVVLRESDGLLRLQRN